MRNPKAGGGGAGAVHDDLLRTMTENLYLDEMAEGVHRFFDGTGTVKEEEPAAEEEKTGFDRGMAGSTGGSTDSLTSGLTGRPTGGLRAD